MFRIRTSQPFFTLHDVEWDGVHPNNEHWHKLPNTLPVQPEIQVPRPNSENSPDHSDIEETVPNPEQEMADLCWEGGLELVDFLLAKAYSMLIC